MSLRLDDRDPTPLWKQLELGVRRLLASGALAPGHPMTSVRDLAQELGVNPATVSKAYQRLTEAGVLEVRRGEGTFVSATPPARGHADRGRELAEAAERCAVVGLNLGADVEQAVDHLRRAYARLQQASSRRRA
jgi:GntR family transcriptional regulator